MHWCIVLFATKQLYFQYDWKQAMLKQVLTFSSINYDSLIQPPQSKHSLNPVQYHLL